MDYIATKIQEGKLFTVQADEEVWLNGSGTLAVVEKTVREMQLSPTWTTACVSYGDPLEFTGENCPVHLPLDRPMVYDAREGSFLLSKVKLDSHYSIRKKVAYLASYDVLGTATIQGHKHTDIGPLHVPGIRGGRIHLEITDAVRGDGHGTLVIQSSYDGEHWFDLPLGGLSRRPMCINQDTLRTGDTCGDELYLTNHGEYIRVHYVPRRIAGWAFRGTVTVETCG